jgi:hypothetical protein
VSGRYCQSSYQGLPVRHPAFEAASAIGTPVDRHATIADAPEDLVVRARPSAGGHLETFADLHAAYARNPEEGGSKPSLQPAVRLHVTSQSGREPVGNDLDDAARSSAWT